MLAIPEPPMRRNQIAVTQKAVSIFAHINEDRIALTRTIQPCETMGAKRLDQEE
jgi:hypothetical protein